MLLISPQIRCEINIICYWLYLRIRRVISIFGIQLKRNEGVSLDHKLMTLVGHKFHQCKRAFRPIWDMHPGFDVHAIALSTYLRSPYSYLLVQ